jgi:hypothetical protein
MKKLLVLISLLLATNVWGGSIFLKCSLTNSLGEIHKNALTRSVVINISEKTFSISELLSSKELVLSLKVSEMFYSATDGPAITWALNRISLKLEQSITFSNSNFYQCKKENRI